MTTRQWQAVAFVAAGVLIVLLARGAPARAGGGIELRWALRGVVMADAGPVAILEYRPTGRQRLVHPGDVLEAAVTVGDIGPRHLTLDSDGESVMLRLGHVGSVSPPVRARVPVQRPRWLPAWGRAPGQ